MFFLELPCLFRNMVTIKAQDMHMRVSLDLNIPILVIIKIIYNRLSSTPYYKCYLFLIEIIF